MDLETLYNITDVTTIGYNAVEFDEMVAYPGVKRVCVDSPLHIMKSAGSFVVSSVLHFPFGVASGLSAEELLFDGSSELDICIPLGNYVLGKTEQDHWDYWVSSLEIPPKDLTLKIILHTDYIEKYSEDPYQQIKFLSSQIKSAFLSRYPRDCDLVFKTSTGYGPGGATKEAVQALVSEGHKVKASGGIRTRAKAEELVDAGASLLGIGFSSFKNIVNEFGEDHGDHRETGTERGYQGRGEIERHRLCGPSKSCH